MTNKKIPVESKFFTDKKINGELYAYLLLLSDENNIIYKSNLPAQENISKSIGIQSTTTLRTHLKYLIKQNYLIDKRTYYYLPEPQIYLEIPIETINIIFILRLKGLFKIYTFLGWQQKQFNHYFFTTDILSEKALGIKLNNNSKNYETINNALNSLINLGLIEYITDIQSAQKKLISFSLTPNNIPENLSLEVVKDKSYGVYAILANEEIIYIGSTIRNFKIRFREHQENIACGDESLDVYNLIRDLIKQGKDITYKILIDCSKIKTNKKIISYDIESMELALIQEHQPIGNVAGVSKPFLYSIY